MLCTLLTTEFYFRPRESETGVLVECHDTLRFVRILRARLRMPQFCDLKYARVKNARFRVTHNKSIRGVPEVSGLSDTIFALRFLSHK